MLIEFSVSNFRSFLKKQTFSLLPSGKIRERQIMPLYSELYNKLQILPTAVMFGPNNAGKSNFIKAIRALKWLVTESSSFNSDKELYANEFFEFNKQSLVAPTLFEIDFIAPNKKRYNFSVSFSKNCILNEKLHSYNVSNTGKVTQTKIYVRERQVVSFGTLKGIKEGISFTENQLFLSRGDNYGNQELKEVYSFFSRGLSIFLFTEVEYTDFLTRRYAKFISENPKNKIHKIIETILKEIDTGILGIETDLVNKDKIRFGDEISQELKDKVFQILKYEIKTKHKLFDGENEIGQATISLNNESTGTRKLLGLLPDILKILKEGKTLLIDELNTSLHTEITTWLIELFNNVQTNPKNAQLVFTNHDITLLKKHLFDEDQIYILEKDRFEATEMFSFADFTGLRKTKNSQLAEFYNSGRLGGLPQITKPYLEHTINNFINDGENEAD